MRIALACDYFYPGNGGVETHINELARQLRYFGHHVIVVTRRYGHLTGVHWLDGLKVYYLPFRDVIDNSIPPTGLMLMPLLRDILIRERISIVHGHAKSGTSADAALLASHLGLPTVYTAHSNHKDTNFLQRMENKFEAVVVAHVDACIAVSSATRENLAMRCRVDARRIQVIPNAVDTDMFVPPAEPAPAVTAITVVVVSRLTRRKGAHLLVALLPLACARWPEMRFLVAGDGPYLSELQRVRDEGGLHSRIELMGAVEHGRVPSILQQGHIFVSASLTEAFGIGIIEAAACGLAVVATAVGGVPELLPASMLHLASPDADELLEALSAAVAEVRGLHRPHRRSYVQAMYSWEAVAASTVECYTMICACDRLPTHKKLCRLAALGPFASLLGMLWIVLQRIALMILRMCRPVSQIPPVLSDPLKESDLKLMFTRVCTTA